MPAQSGEITPYLKSGEVESVAVNLEGTKYTLAVPTYTYDAGLKDFKDIAKFSKELDSKIYGIEPGNEGNAYLVSLTKDNKHELGKFAVARVPIMLLAQVSALTREEAVVFLGWEPHTMNANFR